MKMLDDISKQISTLNSGEKLTVSAQELLISRGDFQAVSVFLSRESEKGQFSIDVPQDLKPWFGQTSITIIKN